MISKKPIKLLLGILLFWVVLGLPTQGLCAPEVSLQQIEQIENQAGAEGISPELIEKGKAILKQEEGQVKEKEGKAKESGDKKEEEEEKKPLSPSTEDLLAPGGLPSFFQSSPFFRFVQARLTADQDYPPPYPYGYRFFFNKAALTSPPASFVPDSYVLAPDDELQVMLYGKTNAVHRLAVQEDGSIMFPKIGPVFVAGLTYGETRKTMKEWIPKKMFGVEAHITLSRLRSVPVTLVGEINQPGLFQVSPMATLTEAISLAGGPLANGSLRDIQILRQGKEVVQFDFYRFLEGEGEDPLLLPKDLVRIPLTGPQSAVIGQVKRPGIYEMGSREKSLEDILRLAGGIIPQADKQRLQVERLKDNQYRQVLDIDLREMPQYLAFPIQDWDIVTVHSLSPGFTNVVYLKGHIRKPGIYQLMPGMRVSDLIKGSENFQKDVYLDYALIKRRQAPGWKLQLVPFDLGKAVINQDPEANMKLLPRDEIHVFSRWMFEPRYQIQVLGEVQKPGKIGWVDDMRVKDALLEAGGLTENAYFQRAELLRRMPSGEWRRLDFNVTLALKDDPGDNLVLMPLDQITIHALSEMVPFRNVKIRGAVFRPGEYLLSRNMRVADLVFTAGGLTPAAYAEVAELVRKEIEDGQVVRAITKNIDIDLAIQGDDAHNILLQPLDDLYIRSVTGYGGVYECDIKGEVKFPGKYALEPGERLSSLIERAGGFTRYAYLKGSVFQRERIRENNDRLLKNLIKRLEMDLAKTELDPSRRSKDEDQAMKSLAVKRRLLEKLRQMDVPGRMIVKLEPLPELRGSQYDVVLENGDSLLIPPRPDSVSVIGDVFNPTAMLWEPDRKFEDYLKMSGGPTKTADEDSIYLVKANGIVKTDDGGFLNRLYSQTLEPGDTIVVPEEIDTGTMQTWKDATQVAYQIAVSIAAISFLFKGNN